MLKSKRSFAPSPCIAEPRETTYSRHGGVATVSCMAATAPRGVERPVSEVIDHVGIRVSDLPASRRMSEAALAELGFAVLSEGEFEGDAYVLFGRGDSDDFCLHTVGSKTGRDRVTTGARIAFRASDAGSVMRWHDAAVRPWRDRHRPPWCASRVQRPLLRRVRPRS